MSTLTREERSKLTHILIHFFNEAGKEGPIGHGIDCINKAIDSIEDVFIDREMATATTTLTEIANIVRDMKSSGS